MEHAPFQADLPPPVTAILRDLRSAGGRGLIVGGYVRDSVLGLPNKDIDVEVFGIGIEDLTAALRRYGEVQSFGRAFGVLRVKGHDIDFSLPRHDNKTGAGHRGFEVRFDPGMSYADAARRRDLTVNSMGYDPLTDTVLDPHGGLRDLQARVLRAVDRDTFVADPLRALRVAQFSARFEMRAEPGLIALCGTLDLTELPGERVGEEFSKLLLKGVYPAMGLTFLKDAGLLRCFPELGAMIDVPQDPRWHPEGCVWTHTLMVVDAAAKLRSGDVDDDSTLMLAALCHDLGKPLTTAMIDGKVRSPAHDKAGVGPTRSFLARLAAGNALAERVCALVEHHLAVSKYEQDGAQPRAYRRLARKLGAAGVSMAMLEKVARADHLGRTTEEGLAGRYGPGDRFIARCMTEDVVSEPPRDVVMGRHLLARGYAPGPEIGVLLSSCREIQDSTGWDDPDRILDAVLTSDSAPETSAPSL